MLLYFMNAVFAKNYDEDKSRPNYHSPLAL